MAEDSRGDALQGGAYQRSQPGGPEPGAPAAGSGGAAGAADTRTGDGINPRLPVRRRRAWEYGTEGTLCRPRVPRPHGGPGHEEARTQALPCRAWGGGPLGGATAAPRVK